MKNKRRKKIRGFIKNLVQNQVNGPLFFKFITSFFFFDKNDIQTIFILGKK